MEIIVIVIVLLILVLAGGLGLVLYSSKGGAGGGGGAVNANLRNLVMAQREQSAAAARGEVVASGSDHALALVAAEEGALNREDGASSSKLTLEKSLYYAKWTLTTIQFRGFQAFCSLMLFIPAYLFAKIPLVILAVLMGWVIPIMILERRLEKRFEAFDEDYPVLLLSYVSLLKTGMSPIQGLESAAQGLSADSMVRAEVSLLIERLRLGLSEDEAISAFGEDVNHPELELFVQSLILSRRVGGQLSKTLERLAKQVRKRQEFRKKAVAAVGMERTSLKAIAAIMGSLMVYLAFVAPTLVLPALTHPLGSLIFQGGIATIIVGFYWSKQVTNIKI